MKRQKRLCAPSLVHKAASFRWLSFFLLKLQTSLSRRLYVYLLSHHVHSHSISLIPAFQNELISMVSDFKCSSGKTRLFALAQSSSPGSLFSKVAFKSTPDPCPVIPQPPSKECAKIPGCKVLSRLCTVKQQASQLQIPRCTGGLCVRGGGSSRCNQQGVGEPGFERRSWQCTCHRHPVFCRSPGPAAAVCAACGDSSRAPQQVGQPTFPRTYSLGCA